MDQLPRMASEWVLAGEPAVSGAMDRRPSPAPRPRLRPLASAQEDMAEKKCKRHWLVCRIKSQYYVFSYRPSFLAFQCLPPPLPPHHSPYPGWKAWMTSHSSCYPLSLFGLQMMNFYDWHLQVCVCPFLSILTASTQAQALGFNNIPPTWSSCFHTKILNSSTLGPNQ